VREREIKTYHKFLKIYKKDDWPRYAMLRNYELVLYNARRYNQSIAAAKLLLRNQFCTKELEKDVALESHQICYIKTANRMFSAIHKAKRELEPMTDEIFTKAVSSFRFKGQRQLHWSSKFQFPLFCAPGLTAQPWWGLRELPGAGSLLKGFKQIRKEGLKLLRRGLIRPRTSDSGLTEKGEWQDFLLGHGELQHLDDHACQQTPETCKFIRSDATLRRGSLLGQVAFLALAPGTYLGRHAGRRNDRINLHLGLKVPHGGLENIGIRVGDERAEQATRQWSEGEVLAFDDSFVHEAWNYAKSTRLVFQIFHPHPDGVGYRAAESLRRAEL